MFPNRPSRNEDESELLKFQEDFLSSGKKPAAKFERVKKPVKDEQQTTTKQNVPNQWEEMDRVDNHITKVLSNIIHERYVTHSTIQFPKTSKLISDVPKLKPRTTNTKRGKSLFAQQFSKSKNSSSQQTDATQQVSDVKIQKSTPAKINDIKDELHKENIEKINMMSEEEILHEQQRLKSALDPKLLQFLAQRKKPKQDTEKSTSKSKENEEKEEKISSKSEDSSVDNAESRIPVVVDDVINDDVTNLHKQYPNMDVLEKDKLRWMENIPHKVETKTQGNGPRFDFEGRIIDEDVSTIPQHVGLHHHKSQPQLPGYNFNELFELARSQVTQQRVLSIKVLGRILYKDKHGEYIAQGCSPFTPTLLDAGLPFILRWFLDERSQSSMQASIETLWSLLAPTSSEKTYSNVMMSCCRGYETNCLRSNFEVPKKSDTDCDVIKRDLILGFLQMDLLPRLRYTLEVCAPDTSTINKCLECIERISQHSAQSSLKVLECPRLLRVIAEKFVSVVTCNTTQADDFAVSSSVCAVRLFQTICQSSWENAHKLVTENVEMVELMQWFVVAVGGVGCEGSKSLNLLKLEREMWNLWRIASTYGLMLDIFMKFPEVLMQQLQTCIQIINNKSSSIDQLKWCQGVVLMFGAAVTNLPSIHGRNTLGLLNRFFPLMKTVATSAVSVATSIPDNNLKNVMRHHGIVASSLALLSDWLKYFNENSEISSEIKNEIIPNIISPLRRIVLREYQTCYKPPETSPTIEISSLPNLGLNFRNEEYLLKFISSHNLLESYMKVVYDVTRLTGPCESIVELMLNLVDVDLNKINQHFQPCIYFRILPRIFYWIIKSCLLLLPHHRQLGRKYLSIHKISMFAFNSLFPGDEYYARDLLLHALFNPTLISDMKVLWSETFSESQILTMMSSIHHTYVSSLTIDPKSLAQSKAWCCQNTKEIKSLFLSYDLSTILPVDWPFIPLLQFYDLAIRRSDKENALNAPIVLSSIIDCLRFIYFLEKLRPDESCKISVTCKITRLMCVFMSGNDIFLDDHVQKLLHKLLVLFLDGKSKSQLNFNKPIPGITSFYDFYVSLLEQFDAVSFGSKIFSMFLLLPLVGDCDVELKLALWSQHTEVVSSIHVDIDELPVAEDLYFSPIETNPQVLMSYLQALVHGKCQPVRTPFMYRLAIHHLSSYLAMEEETKARHEILKKVSLLPTSKMKHAILHNVDSETKTIS